MIHFPVIRRLSTRAFQLYPGVAGNFELDICFGKGSTLIAGVNGLGKSTLIAVMLRCLTGTVDLPRPAQDGDLGEVEPKPNPIVATSLFAPRVADKAEKAVATLEVEFGDTVLTISRKLADLSIVMVAIDGEVLVDVNEGAYQDCLVSLLGVSSFFDALLILRYIVFFLEDRRALVWGRTAQRELLRALFVPADKANKLSELRYDMLSADSAYRNLRAVLNKRLKENNDEIEKLSTLSGAKAEVAVLEAELQALRASEEALENEVATLESDRQSSRSQSANAALARDSAIRDLERAKVTALRNAFKDQDENAIYILARLASEDHCLACETERPGLGSEVSDRLKLGCCSVCGTPHASTVDSSTVDLSAERIKELQDRVVLAEREIGSTSRLVADLEVARRERLVELAEVSRRKADLTAKLQIARTKLPEGDRTAGDLLDRNREINRLIEEERLSYETKRVAFEKELGRSQDGIVSNQMKVATAFERFAREFLQETCTISFAPTKVRIGQSGGEFTVNLFGIALSGGAIGGETPRLDPTQVSLSQREFLDLAFRMALMTVASEDGASTLVVDTPESSLDFLFAERAGNQLAAFAQQGGTVGNRVIVTSNLANPQLIPAVLRARPEGATARERVIDLIKVAADNAAIRRDRAQYESFLEKCIAEAEGPA